MFETQVDVKLHDTDAAGLLYFANYFRIAHTAYEEFMESVGCGLDRIIGAADYLILIAHAEADYESGFFLGDKLTIGIRAETIGETSFVLSYLFKDGEGKVAAKLRTVHVAVNKKSEKKTPLPEEILMGVRTIR